MSRTSFSNAALFARREARVLWVTHRGKPVAQVLLAAEAEQRVGGPGDPREGWTRADIDVEKTAFRRARAWLLQRARTTSGCAVVEFDRAGPGSAEGAPLGARGGQ